MGKWLVNPYSSHRFPVSSGPETKILVNNPANPLIVETCKGGENRDCLIQGIGVKTSGHRRGKPEGIYPSAQGRLILAPMVV